MVSRSLRVLRAFLVVAGAENLEYRATVFIWTLASCLPLIMMLVWLQAASEQPIADFDAADFAGYFLLAFFVAQATSAWAIFDLDYEIRLGSLSLQLLRPADPFFMHVARNLTANGMRFPLVVIITIVGLALASADELPVARVPVFLLSILLAWLIAFNLNYSLGLLTFWTDRAISLEVWHGLVASVLSGQMFPLSLLPDSLEEIIAWTPFPYVVNLPVEIMMSKLSLSEVLRGLGIQCIWVAIFIATHRLLWFRGLKHYSAVGA
jgi:ABC-2 type transport system permease protein